MTLKRFFTFFCIFLVFSSAARAECATGATCSHAIAVWDTPKYPPNFTHFDYANPDAPRSGSVKLAQIGTFDSLNMYILKGVPAFGTQYLHESLLVGSKDEPFTMYGLLAETIELADDRSWVAFELRKEAQWHDGKPITADDVVFSFNTLTTEGHPSYKIYYSDVEKVEEIAEYKVKFTFKNNKNRELPLIVGQLPVLPKHYYETHEFNKTTLEPPLGSGPYKIDVFEAGKWIRYKRVEDYWGKDLAVNRGKDNWDVIQYDYYRDATVAVEAFKAGEYDLRMENISKVWNNAYDMPEIAEGKVVKQEIQHSIPTGMQGFVFNTRKAKFADVKVRKALGYAFDFEWTNKNIFNGAYTRTKSYYSNSEFASSGLPEGKELELLEEFKDKLPNKIFTQEYTPPTTDGSGNIRANLRKARDLLAEAGWVVKDGALVNEAGEAMEIEFLLGSPSFERVVGPIIKNLKKLGITATIRTVDSAQYVKRMEDFDFDIVVNVFGQSNNPGNEQFDFWHSSNVDIKGSRNLAGIKHPVVDALVEKIPSAESKEDLLAATRALDRVLLHNHYVIPNWHIRNFRVIYWNKFGRPATVPKYDMGFDYWWVKE